MKLFGGKKKAQKKAQKKAKAEQSPSDELANRRPSRLRLEPLRRLVQSVKIGSRIRYHQEYEEESTLESLVIGYCVNGHHIYRQADMVFGRGDTQPALTLMLPEGAEELRGIESVQLLVPGDIGEAKKLSYGSKATLNRRGPLAPKSQLVVMSTNFGSEHLKMDVEVLRNNKLKSGVHAGLVVAELNVMLGSIETHEPRQHSRLAANVPVTISKNGKESVSSATLLDFSEKSIRLELDGLDDRWPEFGKKDFLLVGIKLSPDKPLIKLKCRCSDARGSERVFEMTHIIRKGDSQPFEMIDALEIKIDLINLEPKNSTNR